jgi:hypothetical protein
MNRRDVELTEPGTHVRWLLTAELEHKNGEAFRATFPCAQDDALAPMSAEHLRNLGYAKIEIIRQTITNEVVSPASAKE